MRSNCSSFLSRATCIYNTIFVQYLKCNVGIFFRFVGVSIVLVHCLCYSTRYSAAISYIMKQQQKTCLSCAILTFQMPCLPPLYYFFFSSDYTEKLWASVRRLNIKWSELIVSLGALLWYWIHEGKLCIMTEMQTLINCKT